VRIVKGGHFLDASDDIQHLGLMEYIASLSRADVERPPGAGAETVLGRREPQAYLWDRTMLGTPGAALVRAPGSKDVLAAL